VVGLLYGLADAVNLYASAGRGFETPTAAELAYRPDGQPGTNFALEASTSDNVEVGAKVKWGAGSGLNIAVFHTSTRNDIVPDVNAGGRATFRNAARTARRGMEVGLRSSLGHGMSAHLACTLLDARFRDYTSVSGTDLSGNALPGVPRYLLYGEFAWRHAPSGFVTALEAQWGAKVWVDDANSDSADSYAIANWSLGYDWRLAGWRVSPYLRIDNLFDRRYVGSVIVNAANGRYFEPAPGRAYFGGVKAVYEF
jgi:iron complex outermembrane receptor protein